MMAILVVFIVRTESHEVVEELGKIEECLNGLPQDHPSVIETIQDYYLKKPNQVLKNTRVNDRGMSLHSWRKVGGLFFEAGASDEIHGSSTLKLEVQYGWTGLLVEADPDNYKKLLKS